jgi:hypothetical protein
MDLENLWDNNESLTFVSLESLEMRKVKQKKIFKEIID